MNLQALAKLDYELLPQKFEGVEYLAELALDLRNTWDHGTDTVWKTLEPELWTLTRNPWLVLQTVSRTKLRTLAEDSALRSQVAGLVEERKRRLDTPLWFAQSHPNAALTCVAYFSMEFGLSEALPIYSGGLGNVAGDQLKAADDLGVPVVGVGLLYQQGYFRQFIDSEGNQTALYPYNDPGQLPISAVRDKDGEWLRLQVNLPGVRLWLRAWQAQVGRVMLYMLDSNDPANPPAYRGMTAELYGGGPEMRLQQELILGVGGWRLLHELGINPEVCHLNEGHAAFAVLERARSFMAESGQPFPVSLAVTRAGNLFTTHTPVPAGFDAFTPDMIGRYLKHYAEQQLHIGINDLLALGRRNPNDSNEPFNMALLAMRGSGAVNAVSRLHGEVSRGIFQDLFERWPRSEVPIGYVTNGVHTPTWDSLAADHIWTGACGQDRWRGTMGSLSNTIRNVSSAELWKMRCANRAELVEYVRQRLVVDRAARGSLDQNWVAHIFDSNSLTIGFARRFATYKRPNLLLHDPERLIKILTDPSRPVQLVIAGKAHPRDTAGQEMVRAWMQFVQRPDVRPHAAFLADYDMLLAEHLVQGVDLWINNPRRPWEACGTSGMKVLVNGGLNLSELDGWWAEAYASEVGWALGDGQDHGEDPAWDAHEAEQLYTLLEREVIPSFYDRDAAGMPVAWVAKMRESMARLTPQFSVNRALREYTENYYLPGAKAYCKRASEHGAIGKELVRWQDQLKRHWRALRFGDIHVETVNGAHHFQVHAYLNDLDADSVEVELYADDQHGGDGQRCRLVRGAPLVGATKGWTYTGQVKADRPASDYTARIIPRHPEAAIPLEAAEILWQR
ncbi:MAG TPA: alpha-glucan family phosphorylase [Candidatus Binataceae bacterium]|nr:alpha-glucan family phosphorylase [Candidatus Binataceae bacterium]